MTKKHYVAIADILNSEASRPHEGSEYARGYKACLHVIAVSLARYFQTENKAFDYDRFLAACDTARHTWKAQEKKCTHGRNGEDLGGHCLTCRNELRDNLKENGK